MSTLVAEGTRRLPCPPEVCEFDLGPGRNLNGITFITLVRARYSGSKLQKLQALYFAYTISKDGLPSLDAPRLIQHCMMHTLICTTLGTVFHYCIYRMHNYKLTTTGCQQPYIPLKRFEGWGAIPTPLDITVIPRGGVLQTPVMTRDGPCPHLHLGITAQH